MDRILAVALIISFLFWLRAAQQPAQPSRPGSYSIRQACAAFSSACFASVDAEDVCSSLILPSKATSSPSRLQNPS